MEIRDKRGLLEHHLRQGLIRAWKKALDLANTPFIQFKLEERKEFFSLIRIYHLYEEAVGLAWKSGTGMQSTSLFGSRSVPGPVLGD